MSKHVPLYPPMEQRRDFKSWWLCEIDFDNRVWPPQVWDWAPAQEKWFPHGIALYYNSTYTGRTPEQMANYRIAGQAVPPKDWVSIHA